MILKIQYEQLSQDHVNAAADLIMSAYVEQKTAIPFLPDEKDYLDSIRESVKHLFKVGSGIAALYDGELIGFIAGFKAKELFGKCKGIYAPLYGHGAKKEYRKTVYQELYKQASEMWAKEGYMSHALTFFAHDKETIDTWFWLGFGLRCVDAIRKTEAIWVNNSDIIIKKADISDIPQLANVHRQHNLYYKAAPMFMHREEEDPIQDLTKFFEKENHHLWIAHQEGNPLGYMSIKPSAETFISAHKDIMNITVAFVAERERKMGVGAALLGEIQDWLIENGYPLCGVDFESINTTGSRFWNKYFTPYTYSMVRRIDERVGV